MTSKIINFSDLEIEFSEISEQMEEILEYWTVHGIKNQYGEFLAECSEFIQGIEEFIESKMLEQYKNNSEKYLQFEYLLEYLTLNIYDFDSCKIRMDE